MSFIKSMSDSGVLSESGYEKVLEYWFGGDQEENYKHKWFPSSTSGLQKETDLHITTAFGDLLHKAEQEQLKVWCEAPKSSLALVVLLDQFSRHVHRGDRAQIELNDQKALAYAEEILTKQWDMEFTIPEFIFLLMPFRHQPTADGLQRIVDLIDRRLKQEHNNQQLLEKFKKTTFRRLQDLQGKEGWKEGDRILEFEEFEADESDLPKTSLYQSIKNFLREQNADKISHLAVSLSGGVDSMVLTKLVWHMRQDFGGYEMIAIHIDYGNRPESMAEANFVEEWSRKLGIQFHKRRIDEVTRGITKRDVYEKTSREIRYNTYADVLAHLEGKCPAVMFGHHRGDVQENIISNIMKGCSLMDLSGMSPVGQVNGVPIWRPMLNHDKKDIFAVAHKYGIPYFLDTTPQWSTRGKMRNQLMPLLEEMYGEGYVDHLSHLGSDSEQLNTMATSHLFEPFWNSVAQTPICVWVDCKPYVKQPVFFWKEALTHVCHEFLGIGLIREKAIKEILMRRFKQREYSNPLPCFLALRKDNRTFMYEGTLIIFRRDMFPSKPHFKLGTVIEPSQMYTFGPWTVETEVIPKEELPDDAGKVEFFELLSGSFSYYLPHSESYTINPKDKNIPIKAVNKLIKWALPLVSANSSSNSQNCSLLKVTIRGQMSSQK